MNKSAEYLKVDEEKQIRIETIRYYFSDLYDVLDKLCEDNRETIEAYDRLEEAQFWAIKGITREESNNEH